MEKINRINKAILYLIEKEYINRYSIQKDIAKKVGANYNNTNAALNGDSKYLTDNFIKRFNVAFENIFNIDWLLTGEGNMLKAEYNAGRDMVNTDIKNNNGTSIGINNGRNNSPDFKTGKHGHIVNVGDLEGKKIIRPEEIVIKQNSNAEELLLQEVTSLKTEIARLEGIIKSKDETIEALKNNIIAKDEMIQYLMRNIEPK